MRKSRLLTAVPLLLLLSLLASVSVYGDPPETPPPGMGLYLMVLWRPGTPIPGDPAGRIKNVPEPDVASLGGRVVHKEDTRRFVMLPLGVVKQLRKHEAVVYLQRIWMGESLKSWSEEGEVAAAGPRLVPRAESDIDLQWGPKAYTYDGSGNIKQIGADHYSYDSSGRLIRAEVDQGTPNAKTEKYKYDAFGNLTERQVEGANALTIGVDEASNRLLGVSYDAAGNVTEEGRRAYSYDSLNMLTRVKPPIGMDRRQIYDANDEQIGMMVTNDTLSRWTLRDFEGRVIRDYKADHMGMGQWMWFWEQDYFYAEGVLAGGDYQRWGYSTEEQYGGPRHYHLDHLGSVRMVTDNVHRSLAENDYYPFGTTVTRTYQEQLNWGDPHIDAMRFAGHWRDYLGVLNVDNTDYLDNMHARYYSPVQGRFLSVDMGEAELGRPQSWNRYSYALNSPLLFVDPDGRNVVINGDTEQERQRAFEVLKHSLHDNLSASRLMIVKIGDHYEATVAGSLDEFKNGSNAAFTLGVAIGSSATIGIGLGQVDPSNHGAVTNQVKGTNNSEITIDPSAFPQMLGGLYQTMDTAIQHELGHALGIATLSIDDLKVGALWGFGTNEQALHFENMARAWYVTKIEMTFGKDSEAARAARRIYQPRLVHGDGQ